jgi:hypothetical protein
MSLAYEIRSLAVENYEKRDLVREVIEVKNRILRKTLSM